jgi:hypothetical protein
MDRLFVSFHRRTEEHEGNEDCPTELTNSLSCSSQGQLESFERGGVVFATSPILWLDGPMSAAGKIGALQGSSQIRVRPRSPKNGLQPNAAVIGVTPSWNAIYATRPMLYICQ